MPLESNLSVPSVFDRFLKTLCFLSLTSEYGVEFLFGEKKRLGFCSKHRRNEKNTSHTKEIRITQHDYTQRAVL